MTLIAVRSTTLRAVEYHATGALDLYFRTGHAYRYTGVPQSTYEGLLAAPSKGRYFTRWIRKRYPAVRFR